jgi:hypothetical protein
LTSRPLELLHMDLMDLTETGSVGWKKYIMIIVYDYSRYTWAILLRDKSNSFNLAGKLIREL